MDINNLDLKEFFQSYNYFKNGRGFKDLENEIKELEQSKYNIGGYNANDKVQTSFKHNNRIENINLKILQLQKKIEKNEMFINDITFLFNKSWQEEFKLLFEFYIKYDGKKERYKRYKGITEREYKKIFEKAIYLVTPVIKGELIHLMRVFED